tara:strand:- start:380 stop:580 length:201 start_codon:yes stop_codon:yes gene_type:complete
MYRIWLFSETEFSDRLEVALDCDRADLVLLKSFVRSEILQVLGNDTGKSSRLTGESSRLSMVVGKL